MGHQYIKEKNNLHYSGKDLNPPSNRFTIVGILFPEVVS